MPAVVVLLVSASVTAAETSKPDKVKVCIACHGTDGKATISPCPDLAGQNHDYLVYALKAYKNHDRNGGLANIMQRNRSAPPFRQR